jgi:transcriptional regulator with XRE-family HTH domain
MSKYAFIKELLKKQGRTQRELAAYLGIEPEKLNLSLTAGKREFQQNEIFPTADFLGLDREAFMLYVAGGTDKIPPQKGSVKSKEGALLKRKDVIEIEIFSATACCGKGIDNDEDNVVGLWQIPADEFREITHANPQQIKMLRVSGDSMERTLYNGDWVLVDISRNYLDSDGLYLIKKTTALAVKRLQTTVGGDVLIKSDNEKYDTEKEPFQNITIIGKVIYTLKAEKVG